MATESHVRIPSILRSFIDDESAANLVEYGVLTGCIGLAGLLIVPLIMPKMAEAYVDWNTAAQDAWEPCDPGGCS